MTEEDEAFEDLAKRQGDWGMQGSRKHQIMRLAGNVESKGTRMTDKEAMAKELEELVGRFSEGWHEGIKIDASDIMLLCQAAKALAQPEQERNFCSRCGKRTKDLTHIHTCTPPKDGT
jgi:NADH pyrophosphatase NudC (nudix superfamily)